MDRRSFLKAAGKAGTGIALASLPVLDGCKGGTTTPDVPQPPVPVTLQFRVYNHTQGLRGSFTKTNVMSGTTVTLSVPSLIADYGISDVDDTRISIREENFGSLEKYSRDGLAWILVPRTNANYDVFLFNNAGAKWLYDWQDALNARWHPNGPWAMMFHSSLNRFFRKDYDGVTGEERVWGGELLPETGDYGVFDQLNSALKPAWAAFRYGYFDRGTSGAHSYGFGLGYGNAYWMSPDGSGVVVNPNLLATVPQQVAGGMAAVIERLIGWENVGDTATYLSIQTNGVLNQVGKDYLAFLFVRDPYTKNTT